jgi:hypothetical protein
MWKSDFLEKTPKSHTFTTTTTSGSGTSTFTSTTTNKAHTQPLTASPELIARVNTASSNDLELKRLLVVAADRKASQSELEDLGKRIQAIAASMTEVSSPTVFESQPPSTHPTSAKITEESKFPQLHAPLSAARTDVAVEFAEKKGEYWILPLDDAIVERKPKSASDDEDEIQVKNTSPDLCDILISTVLPVDVLAWKAAGMVMPVAKGTVDDKYKINFHPATITLLGASTSTWLAISRKAKTIDGTRTERVAKVISDVVSD